MGYSTPPKQASIIIYSLHAQFKLLSTGGICLYGILKLIKCSHKALAKLNINRHTDSTQFSKEVTVSNDQEMTQSGRHS